MNQSETIRARVELPCSIRLSGADLRIASGVTEELARESLIVVTPATAGNSWLTSATDVFIAVELPFSGTCNPRILECAATVSQVRPFISGVRIVAEVHRMTVINRDPEKRTQRRPVTRLCAAEPVPAIGRSPNIQSVIETNHSTSSILNTGEHTMSFLKNFLVEEDGQDMVEYGLILALVTVAIMGAWQLFGTTLSTGLGSMTGKITAVVK